MRFIPPQPWMYEKKLEKLPKLANSILIAMTIAAAFISYFISSCLLKLEMISRGVSIEKFAVLSNLLDAFLLVYAASLLFFNLSNLIVFLRR